MKVVVEWTDNLGRHHFKLMSKFSAEKYINYLHGQGFKVFAYAT